MRSRFRDRQDLTQGVKNGEISQVDAESLFKLFDEQEALSAPTGSSTQPKRQLREPLVLAGMWDNLAVRRDLLTLAAQRGEITHEQAVAAIAGGKASADLLLQKCTIDLGDLAAARLEQRFQSDVGQTPERNAGAALREEAEGRLNIIHHPPQDQALKDSIALSERLIAERDERRKAGAS